MKILYLHQYFNTPKMSGGTRSYEMARRFVAAGHEVEMITTDRNPDTLRKIWQTEVIDGIRVHWWPLPYSNSMKPRSRLRAFYSFAVAAGKKAPQLSGDVVLATSTPLTIAWPGVRTAKRLGVPLVFEVRDLWPELPVAVGALRNLFAIRAARSLERFAYRHSARIIALSPGMADGVARAGYSRELISVVPNSCDNDFLLASPSIGKKFLNANPFLKCGPVITYAGTLGAINGVGYLVDIAKALLELGSTARILIVGDGKERHIIEKRARSEGVYGKNFWMMPPVSKETMPSILSATTVACSLFIDVREMWNNSANKFFDALASATPVLINYRGWQAELIENESIGLVVPASDARVAAQRLSDFLQHADLDQMGRNARRLAETEFSRDILADRALDVLSAAVKENS